VLATLRKRRGEKREFWFDGFEILGCCGSRILPGGVAHFSGGSGLGFCVGFEGKRRAERAFWLGAEQRGAEQAARTRVRFCEWT
jgi:hypothetical protein